MLRIKRALSVHLSKCSGREDCSYIAHTPLWKSRSPCFFMLWVITRGSEWSIIHSGILWRLFLYFQQVLFAVGELRGKMIKARPHNTSPKIMNSYKWFPYFKVSTTHVSSVHHTCRMDTTMTVYSLLHMIVLGLSMVLMSQQGCPKHKLQHSGEGRTTPARMS
jgi:hypothetical protein